MKAHSFLSIVQNNYDFARANGILSEANLNNCWKNWLTAELVHLCNNSEIDFNIRTDVYYPGKMAAGKKPHYLRYQAGKPVAVVNKKCSASRSDFVLACNGKQHYYEISCGNGSSLLKNKDLLKFAADITRVEALKKINTKLEMNVLFAFYGVFSNKQIAAFTPIDNSRRCTYLLDSGLQGSTSISRMTQMQRKGKPRLCLAAFSV